MRSRLPAFVVCSVLAGLAMVLSGCVYQLGTSLPPGIRSIHVPTFANTSGEPLLESETTQATIQEFQKDGTLAIAGADSADTILKVTLEKYSVDPIRYERDSAKAGREFRMQITASVEFQRRLKQDVLMKRTVIGETTFFLAGDMFASKRTALPLAARDLAHSIVECVVEFW